MDWSGSRPKTKIFGSSGSIPIEFDEIWSLHWSFGHVFQKMYSIEICDRDRMESIFHSCFTKE